MSEVHGEETIKSAVRQTYGDIARRFVEGSGPGTNQAGCCGQEQAAGEEVQGRAPATSRTGCCGQEQAAGERSQAQSPATSRRGCCGQAEASPTSAAEGAPGTARARCCEPGAGATAAERFYAAEELAGLPDTVTEASLGCGNPLAIAELQEGEVVLDLGSGGGIDCFLAARQVGPSGQVIGLDMTPDMIKLARRNAKRMGVTNVDFRYGEMEEIPLPDESVDVVISNCVINLSPDKDAVFGEVYRTLRPGGRLSVSDIVTDGELSPSIRARLDAWAACVAGALSETAYLAKMRAAGFEQIEVLSRDTVYVDELYPEEAPSPAAGAGGTDRPDSAPPSEPLAQTIASVKVRARKPVR